MNMYYCRDCDKIYFADEVDYEEVASGGWLNPPDTYLSCRVDGHGAVTKTDMSVAEVMIIRRLDMLCSEY